RNTFFNNGQTFSEYGLKVPNDCANLVLSGIYWQKPLTPLTPVISLNEDTLRVNQGSSFSWYYNDSLLNENQSTLLVLEEGIYKVLVTDDEGCFYASSEIYVSPVSAVTSRAANFDFHLYPNPS